MVVLWNRADHYIFMLLFVVVVLLLLSSFFPRLISAAADWMSAILPLVSRLGSVTARHLVVGVSQLYDVEQRAPPIFGRATITLSIGPHF